MQLNLGGRNNRSEKSVERSASLHSHWVDRKSISMDEPWLELKLIQLFVKRTKYTFITWVKVAGEVGDKWNERIGKLVSKKNDTQDDVYILHYFRIFHRENLCEYLKLKLYNFICTSLSIPMIIASFSTVQ